MSDTVVSISLNPEDLARLQTLRVSLVTRSSPIPGSPGVSLEDALLALLRGQIR
jgi:hypothetical protein